MKKQTVLCLIASLLLIIIIGGIFLFKWNRNKEDPPSSQIPNQPSSQNGTLVVNNGTAITENVVIHFKENSNYADLPFTEVLKALGFNVEWMNDNVADMTYNDIKLRLDLEEASLTKEGFNSNLIIPPPGSRTFNYKVLDNELILDSNTIHSILYTIRKIHISIDSENLIVYITESTD